METKMFRIRRSILWLECAVMPHKKSAPKEGAEMEAIPHKKSAPKEGAEMEAIPHWKSAQKRSLVQG